MSTATLEQQGKATTVLTTKIEITSITANSLDINYDTLPGNQPNTFGNQVVLWQNSNEIPFGTPPLQSKIIPSNTQAGSLNFAGLDLNNNSYIVGYAVGPTLNSPAQTYGNICSSSFIPAAGQPEPSNNFEGEIVNVKPGTTSVSFGLSNFPNQIDLNGNGSWAAIWQSGAPSYFARPLSAVQITSNNGGAFNDISIGRGLTYTIAIFTSGYNPTGNSNQETMAAAYTFTN
ncbi:hypothetical protein [Aquimarina sp. I32.4]|uniref:hypothetical protein n=1 Tax=Aquimarina sp. I32.4 TaxID=2053903 RepID=UPI000CDEE22F|nr:hypothetical protein [Aquimarina sp. I32.4]